MGWAYCPLTPRYFLWLCRVQFRDWNNVSSGRFHHCSLWMAVCFLHDWQHWLFVVYILVFFGFRYASVAPKNIHSRISVYSRERFYGSYWGMLVNKKLNKIQLYKNWVNERLGFWLKKNFQGVAVPWKSILTSWPAWSIGITTFGRIWVHYVFIIAGPMYIKTVLGLSIQAVSIYPVTSNKNYVI